MKRRTLDVADAPAFRASECSSVKRKAPDVADVPAFRASEC